MIKFRQYSPLTNTQEDVVVGVGTTMYVSSQTERIMSDVWDYVTRVYYWEGGSLRNVYLGEGVEYTIDADMESISKEIYQTQYQQSLDFARQKVEEEAMNPSVRGNIVEVVRGRMHRGKSGKVVVIKEMPYNAGYRSYMMDKLGVALDDEMGTYVAKNGKSYPTHKNMIWVWAKNCEVKNPVMDYEGTVQIAKDRAQGVVDEYVRQHLACKQSKQVA